MTAGRMILYATSVGSNNDLFYDVDLVNVKLGGLSGFTEYSVKFTPPIIESSKVDKTLLEIGVLTRESRLSKWRLWVNNVAITREYKPSLTASVDDELIFGKALFDLKPVIDSTTEQYSVTIQYDGSPEATITHIGLLVVYRSPDSKLDMEFYSGALVLQPGDEYSIKPRIMETLRNSNIRVVMVVPNKLSRVSLDCGNTKKITGIIGPQDVKLRCSGESIRVKYEETSTPFYPKTLIVSSILIENLERKEPQLDINILDIKGDNVLVRVTNRGNTEPENIYLIAVSKGQVIDRKKIDKLKPKTTYTTSIKVRRDSLNIVRLVWRFKGEPRIKEVKVRP